MSYKTEWERLRDTFPPLEHQFDKEERTAFDNWVEAMGFDGIIKISGVENDKDKASD